MRVRVSPTGRRRQASTYPFEVAASPVALRLPFRVLVQYFLFYVEEFALAEHFKENFVVPLVRRIAVTECQFERRGVTRCLHELLSFSPIRLEVGSAFAHLFAEGIQPEAFETAAQMAVQPHIYR